ncbi:MAG: response regulator [Planctomycetota bacterium]
MPPQVLLCDDEIHILRAAEFKLRRAGYEVRLAGDGEEGWESILKQRPDVVITDFQMPRLDGLGLIRRIREHESTADLPVMLLTAKGFELCGDELATRWNVQRLIPKPFSPREVLEWVEQLLASTNTGNAEQAPVERARHQVNHAPACSVSEERSPKANCNSNREP